MDAAVLAVLAKLRGPWGFVYWQHARQRLWFGRDFFGRRSLLTRTTSSADGSAVAAHLTSVAAEGPLKPRIEGGGGGDNGGDVGADGAGGDDTSGWAEVAAAGVFSIDVAGWLSTHGDTDGDASSTVIGAGTGAGAAAAASTAVCDTGDAGAGAGAGAEDVNAGSNVVINGINKAVKIGNICTSSSSKMHAWSPPGGSSSVFSSPIGAMNTALSGNDETVAAAAKAAVAAGWDRPHVHELLAVLERAVCGERFAYAMCAQSWCCGSHTCWCEVNKRVIQ
jgi:hypothetical protein